MKNHYLKKSLVFGVVLLFSTIIAIPATVTEFVQNYQQPEVVYVDDDYNESTPGWGIDHFDKIRDGIVAVQVNGTVNVNSGYYYENIGVSKSLELIGEEVGTTIIDGKNISEVVHIRENWISISGFTITNGTNGIKCSGDNIHISGNIITNNYNWGIMLGGEKNVVSKNSIDNNGHPTSGTIGSSGGIYPGLAFFCKIKNNNIRNNQEVNAFFFKSAFNQWFRNYWDKARFLPYLIIGIQAIIPPIFWVNIDWVPAKLPYDI